jgi:cold-inducible RNA-binding protein
LTDQLIEKNSVQKIHIGNLALASTEAGVRALLVPHGEVRSYERPIDRDSTVVSGYAYVEMITADAQKAIAAINGQELDGQALRVTEAKPPRA